MDKQQDQGVTASPPGSQASPEAASASSPSVSIPNADDLTRDEKSFLLYAETCCVDGGGILVGVRMNSDDHAAAAKFQALGLMFFGRIPSQLLGIERMGLHAPQGATHYAELTDAGWLLANALRRARAGRRGPYATAVFAHELTQKRLAQAIEAHRAATAQTGAVEDESAVGNADAPIPEGGGSNG